MEHAVDPLRNCSSAAYQAHRSWRARLLDGLSNALEDERGVVEYLTILEAQDGQPGGSEPMVTPTIAKGTRKVTGAIRFDDEPLVFAEEVDDERSQRLLSAKLRAIELAAA